MVKFTQFVMNNWQLWVAFVALFALVVLEEMRSSLSRLKRLSPRSVVNLINNADARIVDLRDMASFQRGHIINAIHVPFKEWQDYLASLEQIKNQPVVLVCYRGNAACQVGADLRKRGFAEIYILRGGMAAWQDDKLPMVV